MSAKRRPFDFDQQVKDEAILRQWNKCAVCGESLIDEWDHAHHVFPNQSGDATNPAHGWISEADNCVILCEQCHYAVHDSGKYRTGAVPPPDYYEFSHGRHKSKHQAWVLRTTGRFRNT